MSIGRIAKTLVNRRSLLYYFIIGFSIIMLIYGFFKPRIYESTAQVLPQEESSGMMGISSLIAEASKGAGTRIASVAKAAGLSLGHTPSDVLKAFLLSRSVMERVISDLDLFGVLKIKNRSMESAVKALGPLVKAEVSREEILIIRVRFTNRNLAAAIVNSFVSNLDSLLKEKSMAKAKYERIFLEKRLDQAARDLALSEESLRQYQETYKTVAPTEEMKAAIKAYADLSARLFAKELEVEVAGSYSMSENPYLSSASREAQQFRAKLNEIASREKVGKGFGAGFGISFKNLPKVEMEFLRKYRDVRIKEEIYVYLVQQYEQAKILEVRNTPALTVLDRGQIPERKVAPKRLRLLLVGILLGFASGLVWIAATELLSDLERDETYRRILLDLRKALAHDLRPLLRIADRLKRRN